MPIFASLRNAVRWAGFDLGRSDGASAQAVVMVDPETGLAVSPTSVTLTGPITVSNEVEVKNDAGNAIPVEPLGVPGVARQISVTISNVNTQLTAGVKRISIKARTSDMRFAVGASAQTANATDSHFIEAGERLDIAVPVGGHIAVIRDSAATANGTLCITELA